MQNFIKKAAKYLLSDEIKKIALQEQQTLREDLNASTTSQEQRIARRIDTEIAALRDELTQVRKEQAEQAEILKTIHTVTKGLEQIVSKLGNNIEYRNDPNTKAIDYSYLLLENRFRGSEKEIKNRVRHYLNNFRNSEKPILEIGPGRGELQSLFKEEEITSYGVELDAAMKEHSNSLGLDVRLENGLKHIQELSDNSLGGVIAIQVIEHLEIEQLRMLLSQCRKKVVSGGRVVFETIDTSSVTALCHNYLRDPTHTWPLHPETTAYELEQAGLKVLELKKLSPYPKAAMLQSLKLDSFLTPRWGNLVEQLNNNIEQLNALLYGHQDYCIIAEA